MSQARHSVSHRFHYEKVARCPHVFQQCGNQPATVGNSAKTYDTSHTTCPHGQSPTWSSPLEMPQLDSVTKRLRSCPHVVQQSANQPATVGNSAKHATYITPKRHAVPRRLGSIRDNLQPVRRSPHVARRLYTWARRSEWQPQWQSRTQRNTRPHGGPRAICQDGRQMFTNIPMNRYFP